MHNKKQHIIECAFALFYEKGIHAVGINEIIKTAAIAKKTLYNHFISKDELLLATLHYRAQLEIQQLNSKLDRAEIGKDALLAWFEYLEEFINSRVACLGNFRGDYFNNCCVEYGQKELPIYQACHAHKLAIKAIIQQHVDSFEPSFQKNKFLVNTLVLLKEGVINEALIGGNLNSAKEAKESAENLLRFKR